MSNLSSLLNLPQIEVKLKQPQGPGVVQESVISMAPVNHTLISSISPHAYVIPSYPDTELGHAMSFGQWNISQRITSRSIKGPVP